MVLGKAKGGASSLLESLAKEEGLPVVAPSAAAAGGGGAAAAVAAGPMVIAGGWWWGHGGGVFLGVCGSEAGRLARVLRCT
jgi:hypothetical protein